MEKPEKEEDSGAVKSDNKVSQTLQAFMAKSNIDRSELSQTKERRPVSNSRSPRVARSTKHNFV